MSRPAMSFPFGGEMLTRKQIQERTGLSPRAQRQRQSKRIPLEREVKHVTVAEKFQYKGEMLTLREISKRSGNQVETLRSWTKKGLSLDDRKPREEKTYKLRGKMVTVREASELLGLQPTGIRNRLRRHGWIEPFHLAKSSVKAPINGMHHQTKIPAIKIWQMMQEQMVAQPDQLKLPSNT